MTLLNSKSFKLDYKDYMIKHLTNKVENIACVLLQFVQFENFNCSNSLLIIIILFFTDN